MSVGKGGGTGPTGMLPETDPIEDLIAHLTPVVAGILDRIEGDAEFTTVQFIEVMLTDPAAAANYEYALERWGESEHYGKMVLHGQVIPAILRRDPRLEWIGYAHGDADPYGVPAWWRLNRSAES